MVESEYALKKFIQCAGQKKRNLLLINLETFQSIKNLKYIITSGMRNKVIDLEESKKRNIIVCGTDINSNPAAEITLSLIHI